MSLERITEGLETVEKLREIAKENNVSAKKLDEAMKSFALPTDKKFKFIKVGIDRAEIKDGDKIKEVGFITMDTDTGHCITINKLQAVIHDVSKEIAEERLTKLTSGSYKDKFILMGGRMLNSTLSGDQSVVAIEKLMNKKFTAKLVEDCYELKYKSGGYDKLEGEDGAKAGLVTRSFYELTPVKED